MAMNIDDLRKKIDAVDRRLLAGLNRRAALVKRIGDLKTRTGQDFYIPHREKNILSGLSEQNRGPLSGESVESIFREVLNACRSLESRLRVAYFGPEATFTHQAALKNFGTGAEYLPARSIGDVFTEVERGRVQYGVVPIENSNEGVVNHTLDMFIASDLSICAEINMQIELCLLSATGSRNDVRKIYSFSQPLAQCRNWLEKNFPGVPVVEMPSTAEAARRASRDRHAAAVASRAAGVLYRLEVIAKGIEDSRENFTRFFVVGKRPAERSGRDKTSVMFSVKDRVGALHDILMTFKRLRINLTKIESRPTKKRAWEYLFFVDFLGHVSENNVKKALRGLSANCIFFKVLGSYPRAE
jgi:chorismate mutase/prephenate dehydratase